MELKSSINFDATLARRYLEAGWWDNETLPEWLTRQARVFSDKPIIVTQESAITYSKFEKTVEQVASNLRQLGIHAGDVVTVQLPNIPEFLIAYLAICRLGAVFSTAHMPYRTAELKSLLSHGRSRAFIGLNQVKDYSPTGVVAELMPALPMLDHVIGIGQRQEGVVSWTDLLEPTTIPFDGALPQPSDPFLLLFTSGTSSSPKAVPLTYQAMLGNARLGAPEHGINVDDRVMSAAPYTHLFGLYSFHLAMWVGAENAPLPVFTPTAMCEAIERMRPTVLFTAPAHLSAMVESGQLEKTDLSSLRLVVAGGSACPPDLVRTIARRLTNGSFTQLWGMTEMQAGLYTRPNDPVEISATTAGRVCPGNEIRIVDTENQPLPDGESGELQIRGSSLFSGYFANEQANLDSFTKDGWFRTGDLALRDSAGNVRIIGRLKELINRGGVKYNPRDIEDIVAEHPRVAMVAIIPMPDAVLGEKACCFIVPRGNEVPELDDLCGFLIERGIAKHKLPERLIVLDDMPMNPTRKIIKGKLRDFL